MKPEFLGDALREMDGQAAKIAQLELAIKALTRTPNWSATLSTKERDLVNSQLAEMDP